MSKVTLRVNTFGKKAGDVLDVSKEQADYLVENGHAVPVKDEPKKA